MASKTKIYIVLELVKGGELFDKIVSSSLISYYRFFSTIKKRGILDDIIFLKIYWCLHMIKKKMMFAYKYFLTHLIINIAPILRIEGVSVSNMTPNIVTFNHFMFLNCYRCYVRRLCQCFIAHYFFMFFLHHESKWINFKNSKVSWWFNF
jgi:hypothetical protein